MKAILIRKYLTYKLFSSHKHGHGIHSPFVFDLVSRVLRNKIDPSIVLDIEKTRERMLKDNSEISILDMGSGSVRMSGSHRKVSDIARHSSVSPRFGSLLANMAGEYGGGDIIELGTSLGISTLYLAKGSPSSRVYTVEGCPETLKVAVSNFASSGTVNITTYNCSFTSALDDFAGMKLNPSLVYIDGHHEYSAVLSYFNSVRELVNSNSVVILDDISLNEGMMKAWEEIKADADVSCTVDLYRMGLVFFRKGMTKADWVIRY